MSATVPFVVGQWVRGAQLYGRARELAVALDPARRSCWVVGLRRVGKTSLLRELERRAAGAGALPVFWDLQGAEDAQELAAGLAAAVADAGEALAAHGVDADGLPRADAPGAVAALQGELATRGVRLLLLLDEADELATLGRRDPALLSALWRALHAGAGRVVLATSPRFVTTATEVGAAELVTGLGPPLPIGALADDEARALLRQDQLPPAARPSFDPATVETLRAAAGNHPMLLQLLGRRCLELGDAGLAVARVAADRTLHHLFAVDLDLLSPPERELLRRVARGEGDEGGARAGENGDGGGPGMSWGRLRSLGLVRDAGEGAASVAGGLFGAWLREG